MDNEHRYLIVRPADVRVDLDDDQGFAYALKWFYQNHGGPLHAARRDLHRVVWAMSNGKESESGLLQRMLCGETTPADRLALARAIAEVTA